MATRTITKTERTRPAPIERTVEKLVDVDTTGLTREQVKTERLRAYAVTTRAQETEHKQRIAEDRQNDLARGLPFPGHRKGRRVRLSWPTTTAWERWQAKFEGIPSIGDTYTIRIDAAGYEFPGDDVTPGSGRRYTEIQATEAEQDWLEANGVTVTVAGTFDQQIAEELP